MSGDMLLRERLSSLPLLVIAVEYGCVVAELGCVRERGEMLGRDLWMKTREAWAMDPSLKSKRCDQALRYLGLVGWPHAYLSHQVNSACRSQRAARSRS